VPLAAPAQAEIVLEGLLDATVTHDEGAVSEFHGMYENYGAAGVARFGTLRRQGDTVLQVVQPGRSREHLLLGGVAIAAGLRHRLRAVVPEVLDVAVPAGWLGRTGCVVALGPHSPGTPLAAIAAALDAVSLIKRVVVVDGDVDVDVHSPEQVEWAIASRVRPERDVHLHPGRSADRAEPLERDGTVTKDGIDATRDRDFTPAAPPAAVVERVRRRLQGDGHLHGDRSRPVGT